MLINIYNNNTGKDHVGFLNKLTTILCTFENVFEHNLIFAGDFSVFLLYLLDAKESTPILQSWSVNKLIGINETLKLCDI